LIKDETRELFVVVMCCVINASVAFLGIVGNVINVAVFLKLGFRETTNITLLGLAISDLGCLLSAEWVYLCFNPLFNNADIPFVPFEIENITGGWPHICFGRITGVITAYVTLERCLCITLPLTVKAVLTPRRTSLVIVCIFLVMFISVSPVFTVNLLEWKFYPSSNRTRVGIVYTNNRSQVERIVFAITDFYSYIAFIVVSVFTVLLVSRLKGTRRWRRDSTTNQTSAARKDGKVIKMVLTVSVVFIACFFPITVVFIGTMVFPQFGTGGRYANLFYVVASCAYFLEIINSSVNFLIYLKMSSRFRHTYRKLLHCRRKIRG
ncbi:unnamed protein product, partial [Lymnaea stagnalis]